MGTSGKKRSRRERGTGLASPNDNGMWSKQELAITETVKNTSRKTAKQVLVGGTEAQGGGKKK